MLITSEYTYRQTQAEKKAAESLAADLASLLDPDTLDVANGATLTRVRVGANGRSVTALWDVDHTPTTDDRGSERSVTHHVQVRVHHDKTSSTYRATVSYEQHRGPIVSVLIHVRPDDEEDPWRTYDVAVERTARYSRKAFAVFAAQALREAVAPGGPVAVKVAEVMRHADRLALKGAAA